jgi:hypothetical protein
MNEIDQKYQRCALVREGRVEPQFLWRNRFLRGRFTQKAKNFEIFFIEYSDEEPVEASQIVIHFYGLWLVFKVRKCQKEALKGPDR